MSTNKFGYFKGATMYEAYLWRFWITITQFRYLTWRDWNWWPIHIGFDTTNWDEDDFEES